MRKEYEPSLPCETEKKREASRTTYKQVMMILKAAEVLWGTH